MTNCQGETAARSTASNEYRNPKPSLPRIPHYLAYAMHTKTREQTPVVHLILAWYITYSFRVPLTCTLLPNFWLPFDRIRIRKLSRRGFGRSAFVRGRRAGMMLVICGMCELRF